MTGTPLLKRERSTFNRFGGLIEPSYPMPQAVEDGAVVPLLYEGRVVEREVNTAAIDRWFERVCEGLSDQQKTDLKKKYARASHLGRTEQTIFCIAFDVSEHYRQNWQGTGFKAQLVTPSKRAALLYKKALDELGHVTSEVIISPPDEREGHEEVDDEPADEVQRFWKRMMDRHGSEKAYNERIIEGFKKRDEPEILIVVDKLLTGFDAPKNTVMYLCRKLKEHGLLQAIARVNRVEEGKDFGYIVDYEGVLGALDQALTSYGALAGYDEADLAGAVAPLREEIAGLPQRHSELWDVFKEVPNKRDEEGFERHLADEARRDAFYDRLSAFSRTLAIALSSAEFVNDPKNEGRIAGYRADLRRFQNLRAAVRRRYQEAVEFRDYEPRIRKLLDTHISAHEVTPLTSLVNIFDDEAFEFDDEAFERAVAGQTTPAAKADLIASATKRTITVRMREDPAFYARISELIRRVIEDFRARRISELEYLKRVGEIRDQVARRPADDLPKAIRHDGDARAVYGIISRLLPEDERGGREVAAATAKALVDIIRGHRIVNWTQNADIQKAMMNDMDDYLFDVVRGQHGVALPADTIDEIIERTMQTARHREEAEAA